MKNILSIIIIITIALIISILLLKGEKPIETPAEPINKTENTKLKETHVLKQNNAEQANIEKPKPEIKNETAIVEGIRARKTNITIEDEIYTKAFVKKPEEMQIAEPVLMRPKHNYIQWAMQLSASVAGKIAITDEKIFFGTYDYQAIIAKAETGELINRIRTTSQPVNSTLLYKNLFIVPQRNGQITAYQQTDGKEIWNHRSVVDKPDIQIDFSISGICLLDDKIGVLKHWGNLYVLKAENGQMNLDLGVEYESRIPIQAIQTEDKIIFANVAGELHAFNKDGSKSFTYTLEKGYATAMLSNNQILFVATTEKQLIALDSKTQKIIWQIETSSYSFEGLCINDNTLYIAAGSIYAINPTNGQIKWQIKSTSEHGFCRGQIQISDKNLYAIEQSGNLIEANLTTGEITKQTHLKEEIKSSISQTSALILVPTITKKIYGIKKAANWQ